jgi:hypothetical protein
MVGGEASEWAAHRVQQRHTFSREQVIGTHCLPDVPLYRRNLRARDCLLGRHVCTECLTLNI